MLTDNSGVSQPAVSKHLGVLKHAGLVRARHKGRQTHYSARPRGLAPVVDWMSFYSRYELVEVLRDDERHETASAAFDFTPLSAVMR